MRGSLRSVMFLLKTWRNLRPERLSAVSTMNSVLKMLHSLAP